MHTWKSLITRWPDRVLESAILSREKWKPYPKAGEREAWMTIPDGARKAMVELAEEAVHSDWPHVPASVYLQFAENGNRTNYETLHFRRREILCNLMIGECIEGKGRFLKSVLDAVWSICEESSWCLPAHVGVQRAGVGLPDVDEPVLDLFSAETGALLAWTTYLLGDQLGCISPQVCARVSGEVDRRILTPGLEREDYSWMGFRQRPVNNWNPWINSNWLACALLLEDNPGRRLAAVMKILRSLDVFLADYPADGGCDEGPNYWGRAGASLFDCLELLYSASDGRLSIYDDDLIANIGRYIYRAHIAEDYYLNFADASAVVKPDAYLVVRYGERIGDEAMRNFGAWLAHRSGLVERGYQPHKAGRSSSPTRELPALFGLSRLDNMPHQVPMEQLVWLPGIEVFAARDQGGQENGFYLAVKGGHNAESHNHNDIGHFVVYKDGRPLVIDAGVETYTRKTFSPQRYEIWTMQSAYHSLPTVNEFQQAPGKEFAARNVEVLLDGAQVGLKLDIAAAYPPEAGIVTWEREVRLERGRRVTLNDRYHLTRQPSSLSLSLMTASDVDLSRHGIAVLRERLLPDGRLSGCGEVFYDAQRFEAVVERVAINDSRMQPVWGDRIYRLLFRDRALAVSGEWAFEIR